MLELFNFVVKCILNIFLLLALQGFLQSDDGGILKPIQGPGKGCREMIFYQTVYSPDCQDEDLVKLRHFIPTYIGIWNTPEHPDCK